MTAKPTACEEARSILLEGGAPGEHLGGCDACRDFATSLAVVDRALAAGDPRPDSAPRLAEPVLDAIYEADQRRARRWMTAVAAALVTGFAASAWWAWTVVGPGVTEAVSESVGGVVRSGLQQLLASGEGFVETVQLPAANIPAMNLTMLSALLAAGAVSVMLRWMALDG